jgi:predicted RNase H-like HicB family nuclease
LRSLRLKHQSRVGSFSVERGNAFYTIYTFYTAKTDEGHTPRNAQFSASCDWLRVPRSGCFRTGAETGIAGSVRHEYADMWYNMRRKDKPSMCISYTYWQDPNDKLWVGFWDDYPDYVTQGHDLAELQYMLRDIRDAIRDGDLQDTRRSIGVMDLEHA